MGKEGKEGKRTEATEGGKPGRRPGRPPGPPLSEDEQKQKTKAKNDKYRGKIKLEREERETFCEMPGINYMFKPFSEEYRKRNEESSKMQNLLKKCEGFCKEPRIIDKFKAYSEKCRKTIEETTKKWQELFNKFFEEEGIAKKFEAICSEVKEEEERKFREEFNKLCEVWDPSDHCFLDLLLQTMGLEGVTAMNSSSSQNLEMIQTGGREDVPAVNSSSFGAMGTPFERAAELKRKREGEPDGTHRGKRPVTAYTTPSRLPIGGFMAEARQNYRQSAAALATQGPLFSTNEAIQIHKSKAAHDMEASTSSWGELFEELSLLEPFPEVDISDLDISLDSLMDNLEMFAGNSAGSPNVPSNCEGEVQSSTMPMTVGAMNSTGTGEPHHDPLTKQGGTTAAAGSSGGPSTQSSPHKEKF